MSKWKKLTCAGFEMGSQGIGIATGIEAAGGVGVLIDDVPATGCEGLERCRQIGDDGLKSPDREEKYQQE